jgi:hypothetical protein
MLNCCPTEAVLNGFGRDNLTDLEAWALYEANYPMPSDMRLAHNGSWRMAANNVYIRSMPRVGRDAGGVKSTLNARGCIRRSGSIRHGWR